MSIESMNFALDTEPEKQVAYSSIPLKLILKLSTYYIDTE